MQSYKVSRCGEWLTNDPLYIKYHDDEWGIPSYDSFHLFEMLCLAGQQAGLSWITILRKRENFRKIFLEFDPYKIAEFTDSDMHNTLCEPGIIRNMNKLESIRNNAKCYVRIENNGEDFSKFIWSFVNNKPVINYWSNNKEVPTMTSESEALAKALKKNGFNFVGPTICYAFMQSVGLVNDHVVSCFYKFPRTENSSE